MTSSRKKKLREAELASPWFEILLQFSGMFEEYRREQQERLNLLSKFFTAWKVYDKEEDHFPELCSVFVATGRTAEECYRPRTLLQERAGLFGRPPQSDVFHRLQREFTRQQRDVVSAFMGTSFMTTAKENEENELRVHLQRGQFALNALIEKTRKYGDPETREPLQFLTRLLGSFRLPRRVIRGNHPS